MTDTTEAQDTAEVLDLVEKAQSKGTFDITAFAKGRAYPQDTVVAFIDLESAYELTKLNDTMRVVTDEKELESLEAKANELAEAIKESQITFYMRGVNQATVEKITLDCNKKYPGSTDAFGNIKQDSAWIMEWTSALVASNLVKTENSKGEVDEREFSIDDITTLRHHLPKEVWDLLVDKMQKLTLATAYFEGMTDAGFLPKS